MKDQIKSLTSTRGFAALFIVIYHYGQHVFPFSHAPKLVENLHLAVGYFFVLSGFVMYQAYWRKQVSYREYITKRLARIYPMYFLAGLLALAPMIYKYASGIEPLLIDWPNEILGLFFLQTYIPKYTFTANFPAWSLSVEMFFYLLFPLLLLLIQRNVRAFFTLTIIIFIITQLACMWYLPLTSTTDDPVVNFFMYHPFAHLNEFLVGIAGGYLFSYSKALTKRWALLPGICLVSAVIFISYKPETISYNAGLLSPLFMLMIISTAANKTELLDKKALITLGNVSYGIYILQAPISRIFVRFNKSALHLDKTTEFYAYLVFLIAISYLCYQAIEKPQRKRITNLGKKRKPTTSI